MRDKGDERRLIKLADAAQALREGRETYLSITRLTSLKSLCRDPQVARGFVLYLAWLTLSKLNASPPPYTSQQAWTRYETLAAQAVSAMEECVHGPSDYQCLTLRGLLRAVVEVQNDYQRVGWDTVRIIHSQELLVIEYALRCFVESASAPDWTYRAARAYAERYDPRYGDGLIPASAPLLEDIVRFWRTDSAPPARTGIRNVSH